MKFRADSFRICELPRLALTDGTIEAIKWLALGLMTLDHVNKYLFHGAIVGIFNAGRVAMPLFAFVLAYNLARPNAFERGTYARVLKRLLLFGVIATVPFLGLGGLVWGWWPLNIMFMLMVAACVMYLLECGGRVRVTLAVLLFVVGGALVEFWWPALTICMAAWHYCKRPNWFALLLWMASIAALFLINRNFWALLALPIIFLAPYISIPIGRTKNLFYIYYPAHLAVLWVCIRAI